MGIEPLPPATRSALALVDPQLLAYAAVLAVVHDMLVANPAPEGHAAAPVGLARRRHGAGMCRLHLEIDEAVVAHARADPAGVTRIALLVAGGAVVGPRHGDHAGPGHASIGDAPEV